MPNPLAMEHLPGIDPRDDAVQTRAWGDEFTFYLVRHGGQHFVWTVRPWDDGDHAYEMPSLEAARDFLDAEFAFLLTVTGWGDRLASVSAGDEATGQILFSADVLDGAEDGIWLATSRAEGEESVYALAGFGDPGAAVEAFAARTEEAAAAIEGLDIGWPQVAAGYLRHRAAAARSGAARAALGDTIRRSRGRIRAERAVSRVASAAGVSREFLYHVLAGDDWTWKGLTPARKDGLSPRPPARLDPATLRPPAGPRAWSARILLAMAAGGEQEARRIADSVLAQIAVPAPVTTSEAGPVPDGLWTVDTRFDLTGRPADPDDALTRASELTGHFEGATWTSRARGNQAVAEWPPDVWSRRPGADDMLGHPAIRAVKIYVVAGEPGTG